MEGPTAAGAVVLEYVRRKRVMSLVNRECRAALRNGLQQPSEESDDERVRIRPSIASIKSIRGLRVR